MVEHLYGKQRGRRIQERWPNCPNGIRVPTVQCLRQRPCIISEVFEKFVGYRCRCGEDKLGIQASDKVSDQIEDYNDMTARVIGETGC